VIVVGARRAGWRVVLVGADPQGALDELDRLLAPGRWSGRPADRPSPSTRRSVLIVD
jgi:hypothetical protein